MSECAPRVPSPEPAQAALPTLADTVRRCRRDRRFLAELAGLYEEIDRLTQRSGGRCLGGGGCCKFDLAGHRLYLTAGEMAMLVEAPPPAAPAPAAREADGADPRRHDPTSSEDRALAGIAPPRQRLGTAAPLGLRPKMRCPYQRRGRCSAHARRPLGCRIYFCRSAGSGADSDAYEEYHRKIALLHERLGLPYLYVELTAGLAEALG
jgi:Fe-S-cluster containining protein